MQESKQSDTTTRIANGDVHAFAHFFRQQWPQVYGTALHLTRDPEQAADLAQDVFAKLWQEVGVYFTAPHFLLYLCEIHHRLSLSLPRSSL